MARGKVAGGKKAAQKTLEADIRQDSLPATVEPGPIQHIMPTKGIRLHPDPATAKTVASMVFAGMTHATIARVLRVGLDTLHKYYKHELETGQAAMVNGIAESLAQRALAGSDTAAIFLLKTRGNGQFNDRQTIDVNANVSVTHKTELLQELSGLLTRGIVIDVEPEAQKEEAPEGAPSASAD